MSSEANLLEMPFQCVGHISPARWRYMISTLEVYVQYAEYIQLIR